MMPRSTEQRTKGYWALSGDAAFLNIQFDCFNRTEQACLVLAGFFSTNKSQVVCQSLSKPTPNDQPW